MIIVIFGLPGTGKTYLAKHLMHEIGGISLNTDRMRHKYHKEGLYDEKTKQFVYDQLKVEMAEYIRKGKNVIIDGTFYLKSKREEFKEEARKMGQKIIFIELKTVDDLVKKRLRQRREYSEADYKVYQQIKSQFEPMEEPHLELWSDNDNIQELIDKSKTHIYEKRTSTYIS